MKYAGFATVKTSRSRRPSAPITSPKAVHEAVETRTTSASGAIAEAGGSKLRNSRPTRNPNAETTNPFAISGRARPRKSANRFAGEASSGESVCVQRSPPIVIAIP